MKSMTALGGGSELSKHINTGRLFSQLAFGGLLFMIKLSRVPGILIAELLSLPELFQSIAINRQIPAAMARNAANILPSELRDAPCFLDRLTGKWRYDFGNPFDNFPDGGFMFGTHMYQPVELLFDVVLSAIYRLPKDQLTAFLDRLTDLNKHIDYLVEFFPVLRLAPQITTRYEVSGHGEGGKTVDWLIEDEDGKITLIDVKNRSRDLFESFLRLENGECDPDGTAPAPTHDTDLLFRSLERKFRRCSPEKFLQGAWIVTQLKQEESELLMSFAALDRSRIHFAIVGDWREDVYILTDYPTEKERLKRLLGVIESRRFIFKRQKV